MKLLVPGALFLALLGGVPLRAQTKADASREPASSPQQEKLDDLVVRFKRHQADCMEQYKQATTDRERGKALERRQGLEFVPEFRALADEFSGTDAAGRALLWTLRIGLEREPAREVVTRLLEQHMDSEVLSELPQELAGSASVIGAVEVGKALSELIEFSPRKSVQGQALFVLGSKQIESKDTATKAAGRKALERVVTEYADFENYRGKIGDQAGGILFKLDKLQLGMVAPEMEATDENGAKWKLSDYRGKVVLVDFWGYW